MKLNIQRFATFAERILADNTAIDATSLDYDIVCPTPDDLLDMTVVVNDATYPFSYNSTTKTYTNTNQNIDNGYAEITLTPSRNADNLYMFYSTNTESDFDIMTLYIDGVEEAIFSGTTSGEYLLGSVTTTTQIKVVYEKDSSYNAGTDTVSFSFGIPAEGGQLSGLYKTTDDKGDMYFFRGGVSNNYVYFGKCYWRILRVNGDNTVTLIYDGTNSVENGASISGMTLSAFNTLANNNAYVGLKYTLNQADGYTENSTILNNLQTITSNLFDSDDIYSLAKDGQYIVDRGLTSGSGIGTAITTYQGKTRLIDSNDLSPITAISNKNDIFTMNTASVGNLSLDFPMGLPTADDLVRAGYLNKSNNTGCFLHRGVSFWTQTPAEFKSEGAFNIATDGNGKLISTRVDSTLWMRPVITLKSQVEYYYGTGTSTSPYGLKDLKIQDIGGLYINNQKFFGIRRPQVPYRGSLPITPKGWSCVTSEGECSEENLLYFIFNNNRKVVTKVVPDPDFTGVLTAVQIVAADGAFLVDGESTTETSIDVTANILTYYNPVYITTNFTYEGFDSPTLQASLYLKDKDGNTVGTGSWNTPSGGISYNLTSGTQLTFRTDGRYSGNGSMNYNNSILKALTLNPDWYLELYIIYFGTAGNACLAENTEIKTNKGVAVIQDLKIGDIILDKDRKETEVIKTYGHKTNKIYNIIFDDKSSITCTYDHKFIQENNESILTQDLQESMKLLTDSGLKTIASISIKEKSVSVYEILTKSNNYVLANGIICKCEEI